MDLGPFMWQVDKYLMEEVLDDDFQRTFICREIIK